MTYDEEILHTADSFLINAIQKPIFHYISGGLIKAGVIADIKLLLHITMDK